MPLSRMQRDSSMSFERIRAAKKPDTTIPNPLFGLIFLWCSTNLQLFAWIILFQFFGARYLAGLSFWRLIFLGLGNYSNITVFTHHPPPCTYLHSLQDFQRCRQSPSFCFLSNCQFPCLLFVFLRKFNFFIWVFFFFLVPHIFNFKKFLPILWFLFLA